MSSSVISKKNRIEEIDIVKALAMICVVLVHANFPFLKIPLIMPIVAFFIASGFVYKRTASDSLSNIKVFIVKRIKGLWLPFVVWSSIFVLLNNIFIKMNIYTNNKDIFKYATGKHMHLEKCMSFKEMVVDIVKAAFFSTSTPMTGACWFIVVLFKISILYCIVDFIIKKISKNNVLLVQTIVSILFLMVGFMNHFYHFMGNSRAIVFSYYCLFHLGIIFKDIIKYFYNFSNAILIMIMCVSFGVLFILSRFDGFNLSQNNYFNPVFLIVDAIASWCFLYSVSVFIKKTSIKDLFILIGKRTLSILIFHFLAFKMVAFLVVKIYKLPEYCLAIFPSLYGNKGMWWLAYVVVGIAAPVVLNEGYRRIVKLVQVKKKMSSNA